MAELSDVACVVHVHSTYSDGTASVEEILAAAAAAGADALLLTDHDTLGARREGWEGWHSGVLLLVGFEVSPKHGHLLAFGLEQEIDHAGRSQREIAAAVARAGGLGFPAHPFSRGSRISATIGRPHGWDDLDGGPFTGIEVWSLITDAAERCASVPELWSFVRRPEAHFGEPPPEALAGWDRLGARRRVVGIGGLDAHQSGLRIGGRALSPFPNRRMFATLRTHVLPERPLTGALESDRAELYAALGAGRCYLAMDGIADARGFAFEAETEHGTHAMGTELPAERCLLRARLPATAEIRLLRDGAELARASGSAIEHVISAPGVYRVEARRGGRVWILSNPIYLRANRPAVAAG